MSDEKIEGKIVAKRLTAPRVTPAMINACIVSTFYFTAWEGAQLAYWADSDPKNPKPVEGSPQKDGPLSLLTFCVLVLRNGFTVTGESACASPENFDAEIGREIARDNAVNKVWALEGYLLKDRLHNTPPPIDNKHVALGCEKFSDEVIAASKSAHGGMNLSFVTALDALKNGEKIFRAGWNGKGMFVYLVPGNSYPAQTGAAKSYFGENGIVPYNPYIAIKQPDETVSTWAPSVGDVLANDWAVVL